MCTLTERLNLKVLKAHKEGLRKLAKLEGETMSVVLRGLIRGAARERGVWPDCPLESEMLAKDKCVDDKHYSR